MVAINKETEVFKSPLKKKKTKMAHERAKIHIYNCGLYIIEGQRTCKSLQIIIGGERFYWEIGKIIGDIKLVDCDF